METTRDSQQQQEASETIAGAFSWRALPLPGTLLFLSWGVIGYALLTGSNTLIDHDYLLRTSHLPWLLALLLFLAGWQIMFLAMMLPGLLSQMHLLYATYATRLSAQALFLLGYGTVWTLFALLAFVGDTFIHRVLQSWWWLYLHPQILGSATLLLAGLIQWSPGKQRCLQSCQVKPSQLRGTNQHRSVRASWQQGWRFGRWCLGSNWALMLLMFGLGMRSIFTIALLSLFMFIEREMPVGSRFRVLSGGIFCVLALLWYVLPGLVS